MSKNKDGIKYSIRSKLIAGFLAINAAMIAVLLIFNVFFTEKLYLNGKQNTMRLAYNEINDFMENFDDDSIDSEDVANRLDQVCSSRSVSALVIGSDWSIVYTNVRGEKTMIERLMTSILGNLYINEQGPNVDVLEQTDSYILQKMYDEHLGDDVYELYGTIPTGHTILIRVAAASIKDSMRVMNTIIIIAGIIMFALSVVFAIVFSSYISRPVRELSQVAKRMAVLDFDAKYKGDDTSEIGLLGHSMNELSEELEQNITKLKSANLELQTDLKNKELAEQRQKEFISDVSHELKTPIALIEGYAEALKDGVATDPEGMNEYCDVIIDEANKMNIMVRELLTIDQIESGRTEMDIERFSITDLVSSVLASNRLVIAKNGISVEFAGDENIYVWADPIKIEQVVTNYVTNAINHCGGKKIISVRMEKNDDNVRVYVKNTGDLIPDDQIDMIWNKFYKVDKSRSRAYGGNGIGLSIVKAIMELHDRSYGVHNVGDGVEFWFDIDSDEKREQ